MSLNDPLASSLTKVMNAESVGKTEITLKPISSLIKEVLKMFNSSNYVGAFEEIVDGKGNYMKLNLLGSINKCGAIKPRYSVSYRDFEKFEKRYLPAKNFGFIIVSTSKGLMTTEQAKDQKIGGRLIAYVY